MSHRFQQFATLSAWACGHPFAFLASCAGIVVWLVSGPLFRFSDTWQLVVNTFTTVVTFLMVFVIQNAQNRDAVATQLKLDDLLLAVRDARNDLVGLEEEDDQRLEQVKQELRRTRT